MGAEYWYFSVNELGKQDVAAQLDYIDKIKRRELETNVRQRFEADANPEGLSSGVQTSRQSRKRSHRHSFRLLLTLGPAHVHCVGILLYSLL